MLLLEQADDGTIAGRWPRGLYSAPAGTKRGVMRVAAWTQNSPPHIGSSPHFRSLTVANRNYLHRIGCPFQPSAPVCGSSYAIACVPTKSISSSYGLHPGGNSYRVPLAPTPLLTLSGVRRNVILSRYHQTRPWHISNSSSYSTRKDFKPSNPTASDPEHRATSTASASQISLSYEGRILVLRPGVNRGT